VHVVVHGSWHADWFGRTCAATSSALLYTFSCQLNVLLLKASARPDVLALGAAAAASCVPSAAAVVRASALLLAACCTHTII
jgi:hypothetical protein